MGAHATFPVNVHLVLMNTKNEILLLHRLNTGIYDGYWGLPAGKVDVGESPQQAMIREAREELNITIQPAFGSVFVYKTESMLYPGTLWHDINFFFCASESNVHAINNEPSKHSEIRWFSLSDLPKNLIPVCRRGIEQVEQKVWYGEDGF